MIYKNIRRDPLRHIREWRESVPVATEATIAQLCQFASEEYLVDDEQDYPSPGVLAARLFSDGRPPVHIPGVEVIPGSPGRVRAVPYDD